MQLALTLLVALALSGLAESVSNDTFGPCDPLDPSYCPFPFPNNFFARPDSSTPTGLRLLLSPEAMPKPIEGSPINPDAGWNQLDGFSPFPSILCFFRKLNLLDARLSRQFNIALSLESTSPSVLLNMKTGERVAHWLELDHTTKNTEKRSLIMWPAARLDDNTRYAVAYRTLKDTNGATYEPSKAFKELRDGTPTSDYDIEGRRTEFKEIFAALTKVGVDQSDLQLAWDFTTGSTESITERLVHMRDDAPKHFPVDGPDYRLLSIESNYSTHTERKIIGEFMVPYYTTTPLPGASLVLDPTSGLPVFQGTTPVQFTVMISRKVASSGKGGRIVAYGHGLFGDQNEITQDYLQENADSYGWVMGAADWWGLCKDDLPSLVYMIAVNASNFHILPDRTSQGIINQLSLMTLMRSDRFNRDPAVIYNGVSAFDKTRTNYFGNSCGGILGGLYMSLTTEVTAGVLGVPGLPFGMLLPRSLDFVALYDLIKIRWLDPFDRYFLLVGMQLLWDRGEPAGFMNHITHNPLPNTPAHRILIQHGLGDAQVTYLAAYSMGRTANCSMFPNNVHEKNETLFGFPTVHAAAAIDTNMIVTFDFNALPVSPYNIPAAKSTDTHGKTRRDPRGRDQMNAFFESGGHSIPDTCNGKGCVPLN